jgi:hypothetical protein
MDIKHAKKNPIGIYFKETNDNSLTLMSNIITTNKNRTATAPTYTIIRIIEKKSISKEIKIKDVFKKTSISAKIE